MAFSLFTVLVTAAIAVQVLLDLYLLFKVNDNERYVGTHADYCETLEDRRRRRLLREDRDC